MKNWIAGLTFFLLPCATLLAKGSVELETHFLKTWVTTNESVFFSVELRNTGANDVRLVKSDGLLVDSQIMILPAKKELRRMYERSAELQYKEMAFDSDEWTSLAPNERRVVRCRPSECHVPFAPEMDIVMGFYLGPDDGWIYSKPMKLTGVETEGRKVLATCDDKMMNGQGNPTVIEFWDFVYNGEHWLYERYEKIGKLNSGNFYALCLIEHPNEIRIEPAKQKGHCHVYDGNNRLLFNGYQVRIEEGEARYTPLLKWTRERKAAADTHNAAVRAERERKAAVAP